LRAGLILVAGDGEAGTKVERVGGDNPVLQQTEGCGLIFVARLLISLVILVDGGGLDSGAVGVIGHADVDLERPVMVDSVGEMAAGVDCGYYGMDGGVLADVLLVEHGLDFEGLQVGEVDILGDGGGDRTVRGVDVSGDLEGVDARVLTAPVRLPFFAT